MPGLPIHLVSKNGYLYIRWQERHDKRPELISDYFPIGFRESVLFEPGQFPTEPIEAWREGPGMYAVSLLRGHKTRLTLVNGGDTKPEFQEVEPIPCPKVRKGLQTRYRWGQWEKLLKSGWEPIY